MKSSDMSVNFNKPEQYKEQCDAAKQEINTENKKLLVGKTLKTVKNVCIVAICLGLLAPAAIYIVHILSAALVHTGYHAITYHPYGDLFHLGALMSFVAAPVFLFGALNLYFID